VVALLDVTSKTSVGAAFREITQVHGVDKLDVVVNNAGILENVPASALQLRV
jgi:NAD(P)-dependent dehydrogenase (short-subunit alcohol dehydrogenase family)